METENRSIAPLKEEVVKEQNMITIPKQVQHIIFPDSTESEGYVCFWYIYEDDEAYAYISNNSSREENAIKGNSTELHSGSGNRTTIPKKIRKRKNIEVGDTLYFFTYKGADQTPNPSVAVLTFDDLKKEVDFPQNERESQIMRSFNDMSPGEIFDYNFSGLIENKPKTPAYSDALLLVDALKHYPLDDLTNVETDDLVNLYTLLSDVKQNADDIRQSVADVLLDRINHDQPVSGQFGSVKRTSRRSKSLKDNEQVLAALEEVGIDRERVTSVDPEKIDNVLDDTELTANDIYEIEKTEFVRKVEVNEDEKVKYFQDLTD